MNELALSIKILLHKYKRVSVPRFGTFYLEMNSTTRCDFDVFVPVRCDVCYEPKCDDDISIIINYFAETKRLTYNKAEEYISRLVDQTGQFLAINGYLDFDSLGNFSYKDGEMLFSACRAGLTVPEYFGLDTVTMTPLQPLSTRESQKNDKNYTLYISKDFVHYLTSTVAAILLFFVFTSPLDQGVLNCEKTVLHGQFIPFMNISDFNTDIRHGVQDNDTEALLKENTDARNLENSQIEKGISNYTKNVTADSSIQKIKSSEDDFSESFTVVLASAVSRSGAENLIDRLKSAGYNKAKINIKGKMLRVIYGSYKTEAEAYNVANSLCYNLSFIESAWVMNLNK